jgi:Domain of unknown function (DUF1906)
MHGFDTDSPLSSAQVQQAVVAGYGCVGRYIKNLTTAEVGRVHGGGMGLWLIDETSGNWSYFSGGTASGTQRGKIAKAAAIALGYPSGQWIANAVDFDADEDQVATIDEFMVAYQAAIAPYRLLTYGSGLIESSALPPGAKAYLACAGGWEGTRGYDASKAAIVQHLPATLFGLDVDPCDINDESILWLPTGAPSVPAAVIDIPPAIELQRSLIANGYDIAPDGKWGGESGAALESYFSR